MDELKTERFTCQQCGTTLEVTSIGHAIAVPCKTCRKLMKQFKPSTEKGGCEGDSHKRR